MAIRTDPTRVVLSFGVRTSSYAERPATDAVPDVVTAVSWPITARAAAPPRRGCGGRRTAAGPGLRSRGLSGCLRSRRRAPGRHQRVVHRGLVRARPQPHVRAVVDDVGLTVAADEGEPLARGAVEPDPPRVRSGDRARSASCSPRRAVACRSGPGSRADRGRRSARRSRTGSRRSPCGRREQLGSGAGRQSAVGVGRLVDGQGHGADDAHRRDGQRPSGSGGGRVKMLMASIVRPGC